MSEITDKTLPPPPRPAYIEIVLGLLVSAAIFLLFTYRGNSSHAATEGTSLLRWIDWQWIPSNQDFSHGWFMLVGVLAFSDYRIQALFKSRVPWYTRTAIFGVLVVLNFLLLGILGSPEKYPSLLPAARLIAPYLRQVLWFLFFAIFLFQAWLHRQAQQSPPGARYLGGVALALSLLWHWAMFWAQQPRMSLVGMAGAMWSTTFLLFGWQTAKFMLFPVGYMLVCFLAWFLMAITMPLRLVATSVAVAIIKGLGIAVIQQGTLIRSATPGLFTLNVADACSGLRSLSMMTALAAPYAYFTQRTLGRKWILFSASVPLAMLANALRVVLLAGCAAWLPSAWFDTAHDFSGFLVFVLSLMLLFAAGSALNVDYREKFAKWKQSLISPTPSA